MGPDEIKKREVKLDRHGELDRHLWVRRDREEGGGAGLSLRVGQSFASPGEIKGGDAGPSKKPRSDQEQGGGAGLS